MAGKASLGSGFCSDNTRPRMTLWSRLPIQLCPQPSAFPSTLREAGAKLQMHLLTYIHAGRDEFALTHEFLAMGDRLLRRQVEMSSVCARHRREGAAALTHSSNTGGASVRRQIWTGRRLPCRNHDSASLVLAWLERKARYCDRSRATVSTDLDTIARVASLPFRVVSRMLGRMIDVQSCG